MKKYLLAPKLALHGIFVSLLVATWAQPASAYMWTWAKGVIVYNGLGLCVKGDAGIDHKAVGFGGNLAYGNVYALSQGCGTGLTKPGNSAAVRLEVLKWDGSTWKICRNTAWKYGPTHVVHGEIGGPAGPEDILDYGGSSSCGSGFYGTRATVFVKDGSTWRGGSVWSGREYVP